MEKQKIVPSIIAIIILLLLIKPTPVNAGVITFATKLAIFFNNAINAVRLTDIKDGEVVINKEGRDLIEKAKYAPKLEQSLEAFQNTDEQNFYKSFYTRQAALENKDSSAWKALKSGAEAGIAAYGAGAGLGTIPQELKGAAEPSLWMKIITTGKDLLDAIKAIAGNSFNNDATLQKDEAVIKPSDLSGQISKPLSENSDKTSKSQPTQEQSPDTEAQKDSGQQPIANVIKPWKLIAGSNIDDCVPGVYEGEAEVKGWYFYNTKEGYAQNMWLFEVAGEDIKKLPKEFNEWPTLQLSVKDITPAEEEALKNASKEKPKSIVIRSFSYYCEGPPSVSSNKPTDSWKLIKDDKMGISFKVPDYFTADKQELGNRKNSVFGEPKISLGNGAIIVSISDYLRVSSIDDLKKAFSLEFSLKDIKYDIKNEKREVYSGSKKGVQYTVYFSDNSGANAQVNIRIFPINNKFVSIICSFETFSKGETNPICESIFNTISL